jgi:hypothetical protein
VAADEVMPRFGRLETRDVERKQNLSDPEDVVSADNRAVEARLSSALTALLPRVGRRRGRVDGRDPSHA